MAKPMLRYFDCSLLASPIRRIQSLTSIFQAMLGVPLNGLLLWLIPRCNDDDMRVYSRVLVQIAITDIAHIIVSALTQYVSPKLYIIFSSISRQQDNASLINFSRKL